MNELNKKLAKWRGFRHINIHQDLNGKWVISADGLGQDYIRTDLFTDSTDACFKWLIPDTQTDFSILFREIYLIDGTILTQCELTLDLTRRITGRPVEGRIKDKAALAFCKAVEILMEKK